MTPRCYILILLLIVSSPAFAQIPISGPVSGVLQDTTYLITGYTYVLLADTLTIPAGASFLFNGNYELRLYGRLLVQGTSSDSVLFKPAAGVLSWKGLNFYYNCQDSSSLEYCRISGANQSGIRYAGAHSIQLSHCTLSGDSAANGGGLNCTGGEVNLDSCLIADNHVTSNGGGLYATSIMTLNDCNIANNTAIASGGGIYANGTLIMNGCTVTGNAGDTGGITEPGGGIMAGGQGQIRRCLITNNSCSWWGGGLYCAGDYLVDKCIINNNITEYVSSHGGGVDCGPGSTPTITQCLISNNLGNGVRFNEAGTSRLSRCLILNNGNGYNSGIYIDWCSAEVSSSIIDGNYRGMMISVGNQNPRVDQCLLSHNGGGMMVEGSDSTLITNCLFYHNFANTANGGGILLNSWMDAPRVRKCAFINNGTNARGGGISCQTEAQPILDQCTVVDNWAGITGGGFWGQIGVNSNPFMTNSIIWNNSPRQVDDFTLLLYWSDVQGGWPGTTIMNQYPQFVDSARNDFRLLRNSPCIDAGQPDSLDPDGTRADMGAYYYDQRMPVRILITPHRIPYLLPEIGGSLTFTLRLDNPDSLAHQVLLWCDITQPDSSTQGPVMGPVTVPIPAGETLSRTRIQQVPASSPLGVYNFNAYAVVGQDTSKDAFMFGKLGSGFLETESGGWFNTGEDFN
ncbi:MAG: right-handed parallel beta-helix repeat-containing protein, partial [bacterium]|nr:right-handed parallel beta-helix repeat-containing protein [bacterium]